MEMWLLLLFGLLVATGALKRILWDSPEAKGARGEKRAARAIEHHFDTEIYQPLHDIIVPALNGTTQIDHLIVSPFGLFVIETKNFSGWIFGSEKDRTWTYSLHRKKHTFQNPLRQNYRHTKCLAEYLKLDDSVIQSVIFFVGDCELKTHMPREVVTSGLEMKAYIHGFTDRVFKPEDIQRILNAVWKLKSNPTLTSQAHRRILQKRYASTTQCPKCGAKLIERTARQGSKFLGCAKYPRCRYTRAK